MIEIADSLNSVGFASSATSWPRGEVVPPSLAGVCSGMLLPSRGVIFAQNTVEHEVHVAEEQ
jgi:hypothetical protein